METTNVSIKKILFVLLFGMFIVILNQTLMNVALPSIMKDLSIEATTAQWLITGFMLVNGILIPISAFLTKRFGFRALFITAMISFTIGSLVCAVVDNFAVVMTGRVIQAIGAGIMMPLGMNVFMYVFPPEKRGAAMGIFGIAMILAPALGPTISGLVIEHYKWNVMFYAMFVLGLVSLGLAIKWFKLKGDTEKSKLDTWGVIFSTLGFGGILYGCSEAGSLSWTNPWVLGSLIVGVSFLVAFFIRQLKIDYPLLDVRVFKSSMFTSTLLINAINTMALFGGMILLPLYLQNIMGFSPVKSGLLMLPGSLLMGIMGPISGKIFDKYGVRMLTIAGLAITLISTYEFTRLTTDTTYSYIMLLYIIRSFGMSLFMMPIMTASINALPASLITHGNAMSNTIRQVAGSIGSAILITVMSTSATTYGEKLASGSVPFETSPGTNMATAMMNEATVHGISHAFMFATVFAGIALFLSFFLKSKKEVE